MPDNKTTCSSDNRCHLAGSLHHHNTLGSLFRSRDIQRSSGRFALPRSLARVPERIHVFFNCEFSFLLHPPTHFDNTLLYFNLDKSLEKNDTDRHERRSNGKNAAEIKGTYIYIYNCFLDYI